MLRCIIAPGKAIYQTILPLCRMKVPMLRSTKLLGSDLRRKEGGGLLNDLRCAAINLGAIPVLQWTQLHWA